jgi:hypothetical protein
MSCIGDVPPVLKPLLNGRFRRRLGHSRRGPRPEHPYRTLAQAQLRRFADAVRALDHSELVDPLIENLVIVQLNQKSGVNAVGMGSSPSLKRSPLFSAQAISSSGPPIPRASVALPLASTRRYN